MSYFSHFYRQCVRFIKRGRQQSSRRNPHGCTISIASVGFETVGPKPERK